jgi:NAD(P)H-hydrate repair Nnr-like enzyme with NAD(P)H-hydrate dehydratase domain
MMNPPYLDSKVITSILIGGSANLGGAIMLAARACLFSGSGLITVATHPTNFRTT